MIDDWRNVRNEGASILEAMVAAVSITDRCVMDKTWSQRGSRSVAWPLKKAETWLCQAQLIL